MQDAPRSGIVTFGATAPSLGSVWSWSNGSYYGTFSLYEYVYTNYRFTGYSTYRVTVNVDPSGHVVTSGFFQIDSIQETNDLGATYYGSGGYANVNFTGCRPNERLAFAVGKANDGLSTTGDIMVSGV